MNDDKNTYAAIALALHEHLEANAHDDVSGKITIMERPTQWNSFAMGMTNVPQQKS